MKKEVKYPGVRFGGDALREAEAVLRRAAASAGVADALFTEAALVDDDEERHFGTEPEPGRGALADFYDELTRRKRGMTSDLWWSFGDEDAAWEVTVFERAEEQGTTVTVTAPEESVVQAVHTVFLLQPQDKLV